MLEASERQKVTFGGHEGTFFASWNYPQSPGTAPTVLKTRDFISQALNLVSKVKCLSGFELPTSGSGVRKPGFRNSYGYLHGVKYFLGFHHLHF